MSKKGLNCKLAKGVLTIEIDVDTLKVAAERHEQFWQPITDKVALVVKDATLFARDVKSALLVEEEDGSTPITRMIDDAITYAVEQGSDALCYDSMEAIEAEERLQEEG